MRKRGRVHDHPADLRAFRRHVSERLREERHRAGLTQQALAERAGLDKQAVSLIENAHATPRLDTVKRLAHALGMSAADLIADER